ncbi:hypothetical protein N7931_05910 [Catenovulum sp. 2E275]|uniref:hypothetical protein n=1 Tax=Catenovulum sp. 2E275 TaxID=2980497 RepID=UPI0021CE05C2|nr:hypothetical protein [Catenovulum sp. 2E275]MCU4675164.1 hypothetical protein [Catenovulum sp. 2E275]
MGATLIRQILILFILLGIWGCSDPLDAKIENQIQFSQMQIQKLAQRIESGQIRNANLIKQYAAHLQNQKPQMQTIVNEMARDATTSGPLYTSLLDRYQSAAQQPQLFQSKEERLAELENIYEAASPELFNDALSDPLNVLADLSGGELPRVNAVSRAASLQANQAEDFGAGSQLVGNPAYGQWSTGSNGMSFWEWYGMYALFSNLTSYGRVNYHDWAGRRDYSYYNDYGRYRYSSPNQIRKQYNVEEKAKKSFSGQKFSSAYAKNRTGATSVSSASRTAQSATKRFQSSYQKKPSSGLGSTPKKSSSFGSSSFRSSSSSFSRGGFGGK